MKIIIVIILLCYSITGFSQYIADPSFEDTLICPQPSQLTLKTWYRPSFGSADNFCPCFTPNELFGSPLQYKNARDGNCFIGLMLFEFNSPSYREYLETKLDTFLLKDKKYCISIYTVRSTTSNFALNNISIGFKNDSLFTTSGEVMLVDTFYRFTDQIIKDTVNWIKLSLEFVAKGNEKYLSIGNFENFDSLNIYDENALNISPYLHPHSYYFFDMITLEECPLEPVDHFLVYPNPSSGGSVYLSNYADTVATVTLYNSLGQRVAERILPAGANGLVAFEGLASGVYIAVYQTATGYREEKKVVVL